jgi:transcriptional regulator with GAF, ATPase, and Fis domain
VEGRVAGLRHELARALERYETVRRLDPRDGGEALLAQAQLLFEARRQEELEALLSGLDGLPEEDLSARVRNNLRALDAMTRFRRGEIDAARERLLEQVGEARAQGHAARAASLEINLATLERRGGDPAAALRHAERAVELYAEAGHLSGLAQARALRGGTLREAGRLREAEPELAEALAVRERLGERLGAAAVRGMLGLVLADRGHARAAVEELERAAREVRQGGRSHDALLLEARAAAARARLGHPADRPQAGAEAGRTDEGDPRTLIARARAAWLSGDETAARDHADRARSLGRSLGLGAVTEEAALLGELLGGERIDRPPTGATTLAQQDRELHALLGRAPLDLGTARALAAQLEGLGRDDRAARAWIAVAVRATDEVTASEAAEHARTRLQACSAGAAAPERARLEETLLGLPDPWPEDLVAWRQRSWDETRLETEVIEILDINRRLLAQEDLRSLLGAIVEQALAVSGAQRGFLVLEEQGELSVDTALDSRRGGIEESDVELSGSALRRALATMEPVRISNAVDDPLLGAAPSVIALELRSILCVPFRVDKQRRGVIYVDHRLREAAFDERTERMLRLLADQAALAILQVQRLEEIRRLHRELSKRVVAVESDLKTARRELNEAGLPLPAGGLVGSTEPMRAVRHLLERAAPSKLAVLVRGESGTGKELAARALHELSPRAAGPFVSESCAALPPSLIEAELFGARKGAYTGADRDREGLFERAHGGTLFLDEIGELPLDLQAKLLRTLETSEVRRLGDERTRRVDFRLVAATNRDLEAEVAAGGFRSDLYYRLKGLEVRMPTLGERVDDIPALVDHLLRLQEREDGVRREVSRPVLARLMRRAWPGNVRELANEVARLCVLSEGDLSDPDLVSAPADPASAGLLLGGEAMTLAELERAAIQRALEETGGDKNEAARRLGISRAKIYQRLKEWREQG